VHAQWEGVPESGMPPWDMRPVSGILKLRLLRRKNNMIKRILFWVVWNIPLGELAPYVLGIALKSKPKN